MFKDNSTLNTKGSTSLLTNNNSPTLTGHVFSLFKLCYTDGWGKIKQIFSLQCLFPLVLIIVGLALQEADSETDWHVRHF